MDDVDAVADHPLSALEYRPFKPLDIDFQVIDFPYGAFGAEVIQGRDLDIEGYRYDTDVGDCFPKQGCFTTARWIVVPECCLGLRRPQRVGPDLDTLKG